MIRQKLRTKRWNHVHSGHQSINMFVTHFWSSINTKNIKKKWKKSLSAVLELIKERKVCSILDEPLSLSLSWWLFGTPTFFHVIVVIVISLHIYYVVYTWFFICSIDWEVILWLESCLRFTVPSVYFFLVHLPSGTFKKYWGIVVRRRWSMMWAYYKVGKKKFLQKNYLLRLNF